jgi:hypothetical protein
MSIKPEERFHHEIALDILGAKVAETQRQLRVALRRVEALETQMRREGWTEEDLDLIEPKIEQ